MGIGGVKRIMSELKRSKLNLKLMQLAVAVTFFTSVIIGTMVYVYNYSRMISITSNLLSDLIKQYNNNIETSINELERMSFNLIYNVNLMSLLKDEMSPSKAYTLNINVQDQLGAYSNFRNDIIGMYVYSSDGSSYFSRFSRDLKVGYSLLSQQWYKDYYTDGFKIYFQDSDAQFAVGRGDKFVSFIKNIYDVPTNKKLGAVEIDIKRNLFYTKLEARSVDISYDLYALDGMGHLIYAEGEKSGGLSEDLGGIIEKIKRDPEKENSWTLPGGMGRRLVSYRKSGYTGLTVFAVTKNTMSFKKESSILISIVAVAALFSMVLASILSLYISKRIFLPLRRLQNTMKRISYNNMNERSDIKGSDELGELSNIFDSMIEDLDRQMKLNLKLEREKDLLVIQRSKCELDALQSQIKPHFLYNTLEMISMTARMNNDLEAQKMTIALGKLLRAGIIRDHRRVSLEDEIGHVKLYAEFQRICFKNSFNLVINVEERLRSLKVVKLILQPVVENAVKHGFNHTADARVSISADTLDGKLNIYVEDNGTGMSRKMMDMVNDSLENCCGVSNTSKSIGLANTNKRIHLFYNSGDYGVRITKSDSAGTIVRIVLPIIENKEEDEYDQDLRRGG